MQLARMMEFDFYEDILKRLIDSTLGHTDFARKMQSWYDAGLLELDDYTIAFLKL